MLIDVYQAMYLIRHVRHKYIGNKQLLGAAYLLVWAVDSLESLEEISGILETMFKFNPSTARKKLIKY